MAYNYEAVVTIAGHEMFQEAFSRYMAILEFDHMSVGGRVGGLTAHQYRRGDHLVSLSVSAEGQGSSRIVVHSDTLHVEQLVLDALTEGVADFLQPFCETFTDQSSEEVLRSLVQDLRDAFERILG